MPSSTDAQCCGGTENDLCHRCGHLHLAGYSKDELREEIADAEETIAECVNRIQAAVSYLERPA